MLGDADGWLNALMAGCKDARECRRLERRVSLDSVLLDEE